MSDKTSRPPSTTAETSTASSRNSVTTSEQRSLSSADEVDLFLANMQNMPVAPRAQTRKGKLIFAMDATMSRQATWDMALALQADMFGEVARIGGLEVQLVYFRGFKECRAGKWVSDAASLARLMTTVDCHGGRTQIAKVLKHAIREAEKDKVAALVFVGDAMEESADELCDLAGRLSLLGTRAFMFQEGADAAAESTFREIARFSGGAFCRFDAGAAGRLGELLSAVAVYATGGLKALKDYQRSGRDGVQLLLEQLK